jgi:hypothetical protein
MVTTGKDLTSLFQGATLEKIRIIWTQLKQTQNCEEISHDFLWSIIQYLTEEPEGSMPTPTNGHITNIKDHPEGHGFKTQWSELFFQFI